MEERLREHKRNLRNWAPSSEVVQHVSATGHGMNWGQARVLAKEDRFRKRIFKESWWTAKLRSGNRVYSELKGAWASLLD